MNIGLLYHFGGILTSIMRGKKVVIMTLREDIIAKIERMSDTEITELAGYIEIMQNHDLPLDYDPDNDPTVGFISGPTDAAGRIKEIFAEQVEKKFSK